MTMNRIITAAALLAAIATVATAQHESVADKDPALTLARSLSDRLAKDEAEWAKLTKELSAALDAYDGSGLSGIQSETRTLKALRAFAAKLLENGKLIVKHHEAWSKASQTLASTLRRTPRAYAAVATAFRGYADEAKFPANKEQYLAVAETWEALAKQSEKRAKAFTLDDGKDGFLDLLSESNVFLGRFIEAVDSMPSTNEEASAEQQAMLKRLLDHAKRLEELRKKLNLLRDKVGEESTNPELRKDTSKAKEAESAQRRVQQEAARQKEAFDGWANNALRFRAVRDDNAWIPTWGARHLEPRQRLEVYSRAGHKLRHTGTVVVVGEAQNTWHVRVVRGEVHEHDLIVTANNAPTETLLVSAR